MGIPFPFSRFSFHISSYIVLNLQKLVYLFLVQAMSCDLNSKKCLRFSTLLWVILLYEIVERKKTVTLSVILKFLKICLLSLLGFFTTQFQTAAQQSLTAASQTKTSCLWHWINMLELDTAQKKYHKYWTASSDHKSVWCFRAISVNRALFPLEKRA